MDLAAERDKRYEQGFKSQRDLMDERDRLYGERYLAQQKALELAQKSEENWRVSSNEYRDRLAERERNFLPRSMGYVTTLMAVVSLVLALIGKFH